VVVIVAFVAVRLLGCARGGIGFESVSGAQRFTFRARQAPILACYSGLSPVGGNSFVWRGIASFHGKRVCGGGQTGWVRRVAFCTVEGTLLLRHLWFSHVRQKAGVRGAALGIVHSGFIEAQFAVYGVSDIGGVGVFLSIVLPPADRAQGECAGCIESSIAAARAPKMNRRCPHAGIDGFWRLPVYR
jgi:hypothetical protein